MGEGYCWAITLASVRSCYCPSDSSVMELQSDSVITPHVVITEKYNVMAKQRGIILAQQNI